MGIAISPTTRKQPLQNDVICARGRTYWDHPGNQFYRRLICLAKKQYSEAPNRSLKTLIVTEIISHVHKTNGRFMKKVNHKGGQRWIECGTNFVREKVTQSLRDNLSFKYSSSTSRKRARKIQTREIFQADIDRIVHSNTIVSQKINEFYTKVELANRHHGTESEGISDEKMMDIFLSANIDILETMKKDPHLLNELHQVTDNEKSMKQDKEIPTSCQSIAATDSTEQSMLFSPRPARVQSSSNLQKSTFGVNNESRTNFSAKPCTALETNSNQLEQNNTNDLSCDDMHLDLESPSMFLDDW